MAERQENQKGQNGNINGPLGVDKSNIPKDFVTKEM